MAHLLSALFHTLRRNLVLFALIVLVLAAGSWLRSEWARLHSVAAELPALQSASKQVDDYRADLAGSVTRQIGQLSGASVRQLDAEILALEQEIARLQQAQDQVSLVTAALKGGDAMPQQLQRLAMLRIDTEVRRQQLAHLSGMRAYITGLSDRKAALARLEQLRLAHVAAYQATMAARAQLARVQAAAGMMAKIPMTTTHRQVAALTRSINQLDAASERASQAYRAQRTLLARLPNLAALKRFELDQARLAQAVAPLQERLGHAEHVAAQSLAWQAYQAVRPVLPVALGVLLGWWLLPLLLRSFFYFVLAPAASRRPPIVIGKADGPCPALVSAVSHRVRLEAGHDMLIRPDYCQSQGADTRASTAWLFDWRHWVTSIAAHLWMLKRLRSVQGADIVVSSTFEALDEVALLVLAPGQVMVLQPRSLVGMLYPTGQKPRIRSHWRLGTLHAWLTLQLRYLTFEGPATLIVKGCRGVRLEAASAGRTISQDATLGFSAGARYATVRAEPFIPYLRGQQALFFDLFTGPGAYFLYEEVPRSARPGQGKPNSLERLFDAGLKAFGI